MVRPVAVLCMASLLALTAVVSSTASGQQRLVSFFLRPASDVSPAFSITAPQDTERVSGRAVAAPPPLKTKSGSLAMLLSAVLPGAGQVYAHRYYTIPVIWGFGAYFASQWVKADNRYRDFRDRFDLSVQLDTLKHAGSDQLLYIRNFYHDQRDQFAIYVFLTYLLNIVDAYVGATLYGFDVSDDLDGSTQIRFRIPLR